MHIHTYIHTHTNTFIHSQVENWGLAEPDGCILLVRIFARRSHRDIDREPHGLEDLPQRRRRRRRVAAAVRHPNRRWAEGAARLWLQYGSGAGSDGEVECRIVSQGMKPHTHTKRLLNDASNSASYDLVEKDCF